MRIPPQDFCKIQPAQLDMDLWVTIEGIIRRRGTHSEALRVQQATVGGGKRTYSLNIPSIIETNIEIIVMSEK